MKNINIQRTRQGKTAIKGKTMPTTTTDHQKIGHADEEHGELLNYEHPDTDSVIREIEQETAAMRYAGTLKPFTEGEAIGSIPRKCHARSPQKMTRQEQHDKHQERQMELRLLRQKNDATIDGLLK